MCLWLAMNSRRTLEKESTDNSDFRGSVAAGIEGRLLRRPGEWSDGAVREAEEDVGGVNVVRSLTEVLEEVKRRNA